MEPHNSEAERAIRLLIWIVGVGTTVAGSWVASKIHVYHDNRKLHHDDLKEKVLAPLRFGLLNSYDPLAKLMLPVISTGWGRQALIERPRLAEEQEQMGTILIVSDPHASVAGSLDEALLEDAKRYHYKELLSKWQSLSSAWGEHAQDCEQWVARISERILQMSGLAPHPSRGSYVMHLQLAVTIYMRLLGCQTYPVTKERMSERWCLTNGSATVALGDEPQMDGLLGGLDEIMESERDTAGKVLAESRRFAREIALLSSELSLAIAERKLRGRCKMVVFF